MTAWSEPAEIYVSEEIQHLVGGDLLLAKILARRGYRTPGSILAFLNPEDYLPALPYELPDLEKAVRRLTQAIQHGETICVWGDFDVDGQTATSLLVSALNLLGAEVVYHIPVRAFESHGVNREVLEKILQGQPGVAHTLTTVSRPVSLLLTCDTGISSLEAMDYARQVGLDVIITDHHVLPDELPPALARVNPRFLAADHPLSNLPGVGVAYKLVEGLLEVFGIQTAQHDEWLDLVALGIVADVAIQTADTRYLLQRGLNCLRKTKRAGLLAILELAEIEPDQINEEHIGFELAPRLNALGRLGDANLAVELLTTADTGKARLLALQLEGMNNQRKLLTNQVFQAAWAQLTEQPEKLEQPAIVLSHPSWPAGVLGIVASRLVERFHKPVALIATPPEQPGRGSMRSVNGVNLASILQENESCFIRFGGHAMAAGFSIEAQKIDDFRRGLNRSIQALGSLPEASLVIDGIIHLSDINLELVATLERVSPYGPGNPAVILICRDLIVSRSALVGRESEHRSVVVEDSSGRQQTLIWWQGASWSQPTDRFDLAMTLRASDFRGQQKVQATWLDYKQSQVDLGDHSKGSKLQVVDYRSVGYPLGHLKELLEEAEIVIWAESEAKDKLAAQGISAYSRIELPRARGLLIWTPPASQEIFATVLQSVKPEIVYLFKTTVETDQLAYFLNRLTGLVKYRLASDQRRVELALLAAATAQREIIVKKGLAWLAAEGHFTVQFSEKDFVELTSGGVPEPATALKFVTELESMLAETRAYRAFYARTGTTSLFPDDTL